VRKQVEVLEKLHLTLPYKLLRLDLLKQDHLVVVITFVTLLEQFALGQDLAMEQELVHHLVLVQALDRLLVKI
jgi:hypothetical protein